MWVPPRACLGEGGSCKVSSTDSLVLGAAFRDRCPAWLTQLWAEGRRAPLGLLALKVIVCGWGQQMVSGRRPQMNGCLTKTARQGAVLALWEEKTCSGPPASLGVLGGGESQQQGAPTRILPEHTQEASRRSPERGAGSPTGPGVAGALVVLNGTVPCLGSPSHVLGMSGHLELLWGQRSGPAGCTPEGIDRLKDRPGRVTEASFLNLTSLQ